MTSANAIRIRFPFLGDITNHWFSARKNLEHRPKQDTCVFANISGAWRRVEEGLAIRVTKLPALETCYVEKNESDYVHWGCNVIDLERVVAEFQLRLCALWPCSDGSANYWPQTGVERGHFFWKRPTYGMICVRAFFVILSQRRFGGDLIFGVGVIDVSC